jgi:AhpD family alkylhydroperoxidase
MRISVVLTILTAVFSVNAFAERKPAEDPKASLRSPQESSAQATYADIKKTLGIVPQFLKVYPPASIEGAWQELKAVQLSPDTAVPPRYKELMGLAVASQIPCQYCTLFHTETSKANGASDAQRSEAVALAAFERHWSAIFNGQQEDLATFKGEVDKIMTKLKNSESSKSDQNAAQPEAAINTADEAYRDMENKLGIVPEFVKSYPKSGIAAAWKEAKTLLLDPNTAIPAKYKDLICLAVSSQIPCPYCVYWDTEAAKLDGANEQEISEAIAVSGIVRQWSTVLNGMRINEGTFAQEVKEIVAHAQAASAPAKKQAASAHAARAG